MLVLLAGPEYSTITYTVRLQLHLLVLFAATKFRFRHKVSWQDARGQRVSDVSQISIQSCDPFFKSLRTCESAHRQCIKENAPHGFRGFASRLSWYIMVLSITMALMLWRREARWRWNEFVLSRILSFARQSGHQPVDSGGAPISTIANNQGKHDTQEQWLEKLLRPCSTLKWSWTIPGHSRQH